MGHNLKGVIGTLPPSLNFLLSLSLPPSCLPSFLRSLSFSSLLPPPRPASWLLQGNSLSLSHALVRPTIMP